MAVERPEQCWKQNQLQQPLLEALHVLLRTVRCGKGLKPTAAHDFEGLAGG